MFIQGNRVGKIEIIEKVLFGSSVLTNNDDPRVNKLNTLVDSLDKDWFNYMPSSFFIDKYKEEIQEFKDSLKSFYQNFESLNELGMIESARYNVLAELSDIILATSSALFENKVDESEVIASMRGIINYCVEMSDRFGREVFIATVSVDDIIEAHIAKVFEMVSAKDIYRSCIYKDISGSNKVWLEMLLKLYTMEEILEPKNKMKIVKEIRRMLFAIKYVGSCN